MKKFFIGLFAGLIAVFGSIASVGSKSSFNNFNEFRTVQNAVVETATDEFTFYLDPEVNYYNVLDTSVSLFVGLDDNSSIELIKEDFSIESFTVNGFVTLDISDNDGLVAINIIIANIYSIQKISLDTTVDNITLNADTWYFISLLDMSIVRILGFKLVGYAISSDFSSIDDLNNVLVPYIGDLTSLPIPPSPPSQNFLDDITNTINGVIDWFVDIFNGLTDIFINIDSNGNFLGFTLWGNVLFIEVAIIFVMIALRWVISLIRGI